MFQLKIISARASRSRSSEPRPTTDVADRRAVVVDAGTDWWSGLKYMWYITRDGMLPFLENMVAQYGSSATDPNPIIRFRFMGHTAHFVTHPDHVQTLYTHRNFRRHVMFTQQLERVLGFNLVTAPEHEHRTVRARTLQYLTRDPLKGHQSIMVKVLEGVIAPKLEEAARSGDEVNIFELMLEYASYTVFAAFLGLNYDDTPKPVHDALNRLFAHTRDRVLNPFTLPTWIPTPANLQFNRDWGILREHIRPYIADASTDTLIGAVRDANTVAGQLNETRFFEELIGDLIGGSETTIILLTWAIHFISRDSTIQLELADEVRDVALDQVSQSSCPKLHQALNEALRMRSPAFFQGRTVKQETEFHGVTLQAGDSLFTAQVMVHMDEAFWEDPTTFKLGRDYGSTASGGKKFFPFAAGRHLCPGQQYAIAEAARGIAFMLKKYAVRDAVGHEIEGQAELTLRPAEPVKVKLVERGAN